jgi:hypothetical protein
MEIAAPSESRDSLASTSLRRRELEVEELDFVSQTRLHLQIDLATAPLLLSIPRARSAGTPRSRHHREAEREEGSSTEDA